MTAVLSPCEKYRYALWRDTDALGGKGTVLFVMLNPSTADADQDDPTIRRCVGFARDWGYARLAVANAYALRSTDPDALSHTDDPVGPENDRWLRQLAADADQVVAAWGASQHLTAPREAKVMSLLVDAGASTIYCLDLTLRFRPCHPLYVPAATRPKSFARRAAA